MIILCALVLNCIIFVTILLFLKFHIDLILRNYTTLETLELKRQSKDADQVFVDCFSNRVWLLVWDRSHYHVTREAIDHRYDIFPPRTIVVWSNQVD